MKSFYSLLTAAFLLSCASEKNSQEKVTSQDFVSNETATPKGLALIESSDCQTCHHSKNNLVGPSYTAIAAKYENTDANIALLSSKIKLGGSGVWSDVPMLAHPTFSDEDLKEMVLYILSLKESK